MVIWLITSSVRLYRSHTTDATSAFLIKLAVGTYVAGVPCWLLDYYFCATFQARTLFSICARCAPRRLQTAPARPHSLPQGLYLHAWWHVCAGFGTFFWVTYTTYFHYFALGDRPRLQGVANCVAMCYVVLDAGKRA
jgi:hypothetical protein